MKNLRVILSLLLLVCSSSLIYSQEFKDISTEELLNILEQNEMIISNSSEQLWKDYKNLEILYEKSLEQLGSSNEYTQSLKKQLEQLEKQLRESEMIVLALESRATRIFEYYENLENDLAKVKRNRKYWFIGGIVVTLIGGIAYAYIAG